MLFEQRVPPAVHVLFVQHGWLRPPQLPQLPFAQTLLLMVQFDCAAMQVLPFCVAWQQPPPEQVLSAQHD